MKIALLVTGLGMGGAERQVCDLADAFAAAGHQVLLLALVDVVVTQPANPAVQLHNLQMRKTPAGLLRALWQARQVLRRFAPDVVHSHMVHANLFARLLRLVCPLPRLLGSAHSVNEGGRARMLAYRLTDGLADVFTNVSAEAVQAFEAQGAVPRGRMVAVSNGMDVARFVFSASARAERRAILELAPSDFLWLAVGRLTEAKDYPNLLHAFADLAAPQAKLAIIGVGEQQALLAQLVLDLQLQSRVHFLGLQRDVAAWMSAADGFVLSSAWEGFGLVVAEAMLCERPVVATDCGGVAEVLAGYGALVAPCDSVALAQGMEDVMQKPAELLAAQGIAARASIVARFSLGQVVARWLALYRG